ncbi:protein YibB [Citrobacter sp. Res13-Sevr-PEB04-36]|uniref:protein YibB n=1 Tax=Citrobacter sp. Res13-Sevr-PEB04-36 TaxID=2777960 RepID=UPI0018ACFCE7|nr:protein YibB [Citrobacter sp. Res13-Sevr-PEB04-36]
MNSSITIVTAFFDIGRGTWTSSKGYSPHLERTAETYIDYFKNLSTLDNEMIIFTSSELKPKIEEIRAEKKTTVIVFDIQNKFKNIKDRIKKIQHDDDFRDKLEKRQLINPEYWSADYVLVCNLKAYFIKKALELNLVSNEMIAWIDFGYCRTPEVTRGLSHWDYPFNKNKVNFFTIKRGLNPKTIDDVFEHMINNRSFIIGGAIVATQAKWQEFYKLVRYCQIKTLQNNIVDDDQGIFIMCYYLNPQLVQLNHLGKNRWFYLFKMYGKKDLQTFMLRFKILLRGK